LKILRGSNFVAIVVRHWNHYAPLADLKILLGLNSAAIAARKFYKIKVLPYHNSLRRHLGLRKEQRLNGDILQ